MYNLNYLNKQKKEKCCFKKQRYSKEIKRYSKENHLKKQMQGCQKQMTDQMEVKRRKQTGD